MASGRWLGARLDLLTSVLIAVVALAAVVVSQDAGRYTVLQTRQHTNQHYTSVCYGASWLL